MKPRACTKIRAGIRANSEGRFFATPRVASPVDYFTIETNFKAASLWVKDLRACESSVLVPEAGLLEAELFSSIGVPVALTWPTCRPQDRVEIVLLNKSPVSAIVTVRIFWKVAEAAIDAGT